MRVLAGMCLGLWWVGIGAALGFNGHTVREGALELEVGEFAPPEQAEAPVSVPVVLRNRGGREVSCDLVLHGLVDEWRSVGAISLPVRVKPEGEVRAAFRIEARDGVEAALYPVHVSARDAQSGLNLHAVRIFEAKVAKEPAGSDRPMRLVVPESGVVSLVEAARSRVNWELADGTHGGRAPGWSGTDEETGTTRSVREVDRGGTRRAIGIHPPWRNGAGVVRCEIPVRLPAVGPLVLDYATAVRDPDQQGNAGDGITFRIRIDGESVSERHHGSRTWLEERVDLSRWAGKEVTIALETHPGPTMNTAFDQGYWGEPVIRTGPEPRMATEAESAALQDRALKLLDGPADTGTPVVALGNGGRAVLVGGPNGLVDGVIGLGMGGKTVRFRGFELAIEGSLLGTRNSKTQVERVETVRTETEAWRLVHHCRDGSGTFTVEMTAWAEGDGLRLQTKCPRRITRLALGPADQRAQRVYGGHGYVIENPESMRLGFGGHSLASSHVAADFDDGLTVLTASDHPPVAFEVDPEQHRYSLVTRYDATLTLIPGVAGGLETAVRYRPLYDKPAAPGVEAKAGRFVFDIWGGRYTELTKLMRGAIDYGLTDSMLTAHVWQRWGYDYRLPDIFPPDPRFGTLDEMRGLSRFCREHDIPWGLHDNYIDFYPDAGDYSYERICFSEGGHPVKAWINEGRDAQSYRWRPDSFQPFLERNLKLIVPAVQPTHSFVDVFTSIPPVEFYGRDGTFHSAVETRRHWGEAFTTIREALHGPAITTSEAGHDQLTGSLDGADCQFLQLSPTPERFNLTVKCGDWERIPWMDAVLHDRFILHGVGYSGRYQGGRGRDHHGIESDDYISAEILTGHALMTDRAAGLHGAVRKYWLAQPVARALAMDTIDTAGWEKGDLHRQHVHWRKGMKVTLNRGSDDWKVGDTVLPKFGFIADDGKVRAAIERINGLVVEQSRWPGGYYVNSRTQRLPGSPQPITPRAGKFESLEPRSFRLPIRWSARWPAEEDARVFVHVVAERDQKDEGIVAQGDHAPEIPTNKWSGEMVSGSKVLIRLPETLPAENYPVVVGLHADGRRLPLLGKRFGSASYQIGTVRLDANGSVTFEASAFEVPEIPGNRPGTMVDFGVAATDGAFRAELGADTITITPLPEATPMRIHLRTPKAWGQHTEYQVEVLGHNGPASDTVPAKSSAGTIVFRTRQGDFAYRVKRRD